MTVIGYVIHIRIAAGLTALTTRPAFSVGLLGGASYVNIFYIILEGGKSDPKLALLRLDAERAEIWLDASSVIAGIKMLLGVDPKPDYKDKVAEVSLRG